MFDTSLCRTCQCLFERPILLAGGLGRVRNVLQRPHGPAQASRRVQGQRVGARRQGAGASCTIFRPTTRGSCCPSHEAQVKQRGQCWQAACATTGICAEPGAPGGPAHAGGRVPRLWLESCSTSLRTHLPRSQAVWRGRMARDELWYDLQAAQTMQTAPLAVSAVASKPPPQPLACSEPGSGGASQSVGASASAG